MASLAKVLGPKVSRERPSSLLGALFGYGLIDRSVCVSSDCPGPNRCWDRRGQPLLIGRIFRLRHAVPLDCGASTSVLVQSPARTARLLHPIRSSGGGWLPFNEKLTAARARSHAGKDSAYHGRQ